MKKFIYIIIFSISILSFAQMGPNRFEESESVSAVPKEEVIQPPLASDNPGQPGDPTPIDDYLPLLVITAMGLIVYHQYRKRPSL